MPKIDISAVPTRTGSSYPGKLADQMAGRSQQGLGDAGGLTQFGANLVRLAPKAASSLRHWHEKQDEFLIVIEGALTLIDDNGETPLKVGDCCAFPAGDANGHHIVNLSGQDGAFLVVGTRTPTETGWYSDIDMMVTAADGKMAFTRKDGSAMEDT
ncbi:cupin domain-containing protein [uncultured Pelagimonas sp.]|uniref:cupin domain-containing protein n=1 Tax=uncultured Pelagimonas sp. TaxID=1618102 RepID=UPI00261CEF31|nr:cupin domain-containing protein [uncultured Pelagimonas sp.]